MAMKSADRAQPDGGQSAAWDPELTRRLVGFLAPVLRRYFRAQVRGLENIPHAGGALLVSNHSGGQFTLDVPILAVEFYEEFGYGRSMTTLAHDILLAGPMAKVLPRIGLIRANRENADTALRDGQVVVVFPGGDYDAYRPTFSQNVIDFNGRRGYVRTAIEAGVPIIPVVSVGGQENQFYVTRGEGLAKRIGGIAKRARLSQVPIAIGLPFGISIGGLLPPNIPLPTKIVTQILEPIYIAEEFGTNPDIDKVDALVRDVMQCALNGLHDERRFPVWG